MPEDLTLEQLRQQLGGCGHWLEHRSDVVLSPGDRRSAFGLTSQVPAGPELGGSRSRSTGAMSPEDADAVLIAEDPDDPRRPRSGRSMVGFLVVVSAIVGLGFVALAALANRTDQPTEAADALATADTTPSTTPWTGDGPRPLTTLESFDTTTTTEVSPGNPAPQPPADTVATSDQPSGNDDTSTTVPSQTVPTVEPGPTTSGPSTTTTGPAATGTWMGPPPGDLARFLNPSNGTTIDSNLPTTFRVSPVNGAVGYRFHGFQNGEQVMGIETTEPSFLLPSRLLSLNEWTIENGELLVTVDGFNSSGAVVSTGSVTVLVQAGGGPPRLGP